MLVFPGVVAHLGFDCVGTGAVASRWENPVL